MSENRFVVHPSVVYKLGEDLVTDEVQAVVELVKNSYDADATYANIRIQTATDDNDGFVEISDDGVGMDLKTIRRGWLTISDSPKVAMKAAGATTSKGRTPLGDKGLGRLAVQRLGETISITTVPEGGTAHRVQFDWRDFARFESLEDVPVRVSRISSPDRPHGTAIRVTHLRDGGAWASDKSLLANELSKLISPYQEVDRFRLVTVVDGERLDLADIGARMRNAALVHYEFDFDGQVISMRGRMKLALLRPPRKADRAAFVREVEADGGADLREFLLRKPQAQDLNLRRSSKGWFLEFERQERLDELPGTVPSGAEPASPGPFTGQVDGYSLARPAVDEQEVFSSASEFKGLIKALSGIRVYRDGFGVRVGDDWLQLGRSWSSGTSYYGLKPQSSLGYVAISARDNGQLVETTDREGFKETAAFTNLRLLMGRFIKFAEDAQGFVGRQTVEFKDRLEPDAPAPDLDVAVAELEGALQRGRAYAEEVRTTRHTLARSASSATDLADELDEDDPVAREVREVLATVAMNVTAAAVLLERIEAYGNELSTYVDLGRDLQSRHAAVEQQLDMAYETIGLGLTAESLAHEIRNIADRLARRTSQLRSYLRKQETPDPRTEAFVTQVQTTVAALRRQMAHLDPSLRYVRERRETFDVATFVKDSADFHNSRWRSRDVPIRIDREVDDNFSVHMNRGKLQQILDNLVLNAEYWLQQDLRRERIEQGIISITTEAPEIEVSDNGLGVAPAVESALFEPFVTAKPTGEGRGLGLFIVRRLLESEGCDVGLLRARNEHGRRYRFQLNLGGVSAD